MPQRRCDINLDQLATLVGNIICSLGMAVGGTVALIYWAKRGFPKFWKGWFD